MASGYPQQMNNPINTTTGYPTQQIDNTNLSPPPPPYGYNPNMGSNQPTPQHTYVQQQTTYIDRNTTNSLRTAIPELPMALAITLCIINFIIPGLGTIIAGFSVLCCGNVGQSDKSRFGTFCINFWIGIAQLVLILGGIGWPWSIMWGVAFIAIAAEANKRKEQENCQTVVVTQQNVPASPQAATVYVVPT